MYCASKEYWTHEIVRDENICLKKRYKKSVIKFGAFIYFLYFCASFVYVCVSSTNEQYFEIYDKPFIICELESSVLWFALDARGRD